MVQAQATIPANVAALKVLFDAKFLIVKSRTAWKKELAELKYVAGEPILPTINQFVLISEKLSWPLEVQIERFIKILPLSIRQFVVSSTHDTFQDVANSIRSYQQLIEVDTLSHVFKNVSFSAPTCNICEGDHKTVDGVLLRPIVEPRSSKPLSPDDHLWDSGRQRPINRGKPRRP